ncbi:MAG: sulfur carrier protein ThiS [bacterium]
MRININGKEHQFDKSLTLEEILKELNIQQDQGIAIALNNTVIARSQFSMTKVKEGDAIEIIHAVAGG